MAKIQLYQKYFSVYLNIISRVSFIDKIHLYDLFAGEGVYENGEKGSPLVAIECIKNHYFGNKKKCPNLEVHFNDFGKSEISPNLSKIQRVQEFVAKEFVPNNVKINYHEISYSTIISNVIVSLNNLKQSERALLFIDPWGYKEIKPIDLKNLMHNGKTEIILFLPIYHMYRFAQKSLTATDFPGGKPLEKFLTELYGGQMPDVATSRKFITSLSNKFLEFLQIKYSDTFTIEREKGNFFCLFFFTNNKKGYQKMLETKWLLDEERGDGFRINESPGQVGLFDMMEVDNYQDQVRRYLKSGKVTNHDLFDFGLTNRHLPKHTNMILKSMDKEGVIEVLPLDGLEARGYYIGDVKRTILIKPKDGTVKN